MYIWTHIRLPLLAFFLVVSASAAVEDSFDGGNVEVKGVEGQQNIPVSQEEMKELMRKMTEKPDDRKQNIIPRSQVEPPKSLKDQPRTVK